MKTSLQKSQLIIIIFLSLAIFAGIKISESSKLEEVYADSNIPTADFQPANVENINSSSERIYKDYSASATVKNFDKRTFVLDQYFLSRKSPLYGTAYLFIDACVKFGAPKDCTIVAAIAMNETHLCTYSNSAEMHNCWGYGGPAEYRVHFSSWKEGIDKVTDVLANQYGYKYMIDPSLMERTFCGSEPGCTGWGNKIKSFMKEINEYSKSLDMGDLFELR